MSLIGKLRSFCFHDDCKATRYEAATQLERMQAFLRRFIEIEEGTDQTGFNPHVEQLLMDLAKEVRASLDSRGHSSGKPA